MIHVRMPHGKGDAMQAARYLLSEKDHAGKPRRVAPEILDGDPLMVASIANQTHRAHKYACGCLSFRDSEQPTPAQQKEIMRDFERTFCLVFRRASTMRLRGWPTKTRAILN